MSTISFTFISLIDKSFLSILYGFTFDSGFTADYLLIVRHGLGGTQLDLDFAELGEGGKGSLIGRFDPVSLGGPGPFEASNGVVIGFDNTNSAGIGSTQGQLANQESASLVSTGLELSIPMNLIGSPRGEIKICAEPADGNLLRLVLRDAGIGIPEELQARIFDSFLTGRRGGTGLGLAIAKKILQDHGGDVELVESSSQGTSFRLTLPIAEAEQN